MTIVAVQCRLSSTRLEKKALLPLQKKELIAWTLECLKKVTADEYWLCCDEDSYATLNKIAKKYGWNCFKGPSEDVLERYCLLAEKTKADIIVRATGDNPFLFYEAANESIKIFKKQKCDFFTYLNLPHGSGVEIISAQALLKARTLTKDKYDKEHVGPALYNHQETFNCVFLPAPKKWAEESKKSEGFRTTVDTENDYRLAKKIVSILSDVGVDGVYKAKDIFYALHKIENERNVLLVPAVKKGCGTGHLYRTLELVAELKRQNINASVYVYDTPSKENEILLAKALKDKVLNTDTLLYDEPSSGEFSHVVVDNFITSKAVYNTLSRIAPIISIDEGSPINNKIEYALNIIPSLNNKENVNACIPTLLKLNNAKKNTCKDIKKILISIGGEDPAHFSETLFALLSDIYKNDTVTVTSTHIKAIKNLREHIHEYDLVITHYGLTAFEAISAGCKVLLVATSKIHKQLAKKYDCKCITKSDCKKEILQNAIMSLKHLETLKHALAQTSILKFKNYSSFISSITQAKKYSCPICNNQNNIDNVISRDEIKTIKKCKSCGMLYVSFCIQEEKQYTKNYFFDEYKKQYGKTYLEDFELIKLNGGIRINRILHILKNKLQNVEDTILDIGCAYGPFLQAAQMFDFIPYGTDVSRDAVKYVQNNLSINAQVAKFPDFNVYDVFGKNAPASGMFRAITMWYVIEHFQNLDSVLKRVNELLLMGGVFAFSTPNASGISRRVNEKAFFTQSPYDHFSIWDTRSCHKILKKYGFKVKKIVSTGVHWQRYPKIIQKLHLFFIELLAKVFFLGDTCEVYCIKIKDIT